MEEYNNVLKFYNILPLFPSVWIRSRLKVTLPMRSSPLEVKHKYFIKIQSIALSTANVTKSEITVSTIIRWHMLQTCHLLINEFLESSLKLK